MGEVENNFFTNIVRIPNYTNVNLFFNESLAGIRGIGGRKTGPFLFKNGRSVLVDCVWWHVVS